ncbi:UDP-2,4-diacetamido-2,4,6-trideoxy-beta-L-altropyranose hydrolase [Rhizobium sp. CNPSo 3490]|uniref:UDP-2,4-diacetamido-2,4, 6-trideoxy-beta-L-altropyranose hydrolase n=1 Tax=Rhizobium sp. CNPSo 3490 TaxID=3021407 RepID=UPI00254EEABA|nr:UDP-2,4-diacetamido-2,4,6-trideoxy-beta-L-altropyranose hydrolase [Rhizobium sp. CNPSo 3490]MDK4736454.1 UDP-2,4-diacetamido-2,4,6-trideoxy-beta-L-altropyranose hydrolase [Rhizobium sp. CNPSo 3490]
MQASGGSTNGGRQSAVTQGDVKRRKVLFRADASETMGAGHIMRCLTLADALAVEFIDCVFVCRSIPVSLARRIEASGHSVTVIEATFGVPDVLTEAIWSIEMQEEDARHCLDAVAGQVFDWVVVDHYGLDGHWQAVARSRIRRIMVIDDLANRVHDCDLLLDQNLGRKPSDYEGLVPPSARVLAGTEFALLRPQFAAARAARLSKRESLSFSRLLISLGGGDPQNLTGRLLSMLDEMQLPETLRITVVLGALARFADDVREAALKARRPTEVLFDVNDMAGLMAECDVAIGAAGATAWERCCVGLPSIVLVVAENQRPGALALAEAGCALVAFSDKPGGLRVELDEAFRELLSGGREAISRNIENLGIDGLGAQRVARALAQVEATMLVGRLRRVGEADLDLLLEWRNDNAIRMSMLTQDVIDPDEHRAWFDKAAISADRRLLIFERGGEPSGFVNFRIDPANRTATWGFYKAPAAARGTGRLLGKAALDYAFGQLGLHKVWAEVLPSNEASNGMHVSLGFRQEGKLREAYKIGGSYSDVVYYGLLEQDWNDYAENECKH